MGFSDYEYERVKLDPLAPEIDAIPRKILEAGTEKEFLELLKEADSFRRRLVSMYNICYIRHTIDTSDESVSYTHLTLPTTSRV